MRITEGQLRRIIRQELWEMKGVTMSVEDEVAAYIKKHFVPGKPLVLPAHLAGKVAGPSISGMEGPGAQAAMQVRKPQIRGFKRPEDIELGSEFGEEEEEEEEFPGTLSRIVREEVARLLEGRTLLGDMEIRTNSGADGLPDFGEVADDIVRSLGRNGAKSLHDDVMANDPNAMAELQQIIADVSGGMVDFDDPRSRGFTERVLRAMKQAFSVDEPGEYKGRASSVKELPPMVANLMDDILIRLENHPRGQTRRALEIWLSGSEDRRRPLYLDQALNALLWRERITQDDAGVFKIGARAPTMADITKRVFGSLD